MLSSDAGPSVLEVVGGPEPNVLQLPGVVARGPEPYLVQLEDPAAPGVPTHTNARSVEQTVALPDSGQTSRKEGKDGNDCKPSKDGKSETVLVSLHGNTQLNLLGSPEDLPCTREIMKIGQIVVLFF